MDLLCHEEGSMSSVQKTILDKNLINDERVLDKLLRLEDHYIPRCDYFKILQKEIKPFMRKLVVTWMFEVCRSIFVLVLYCLFFFFFQWDIVVMKTGYTWYAYMMNFCLLKCQKSLHCRICPLILERILQLLCN